MSCQKTPAAAPHPKVQAWFEAQDPEQPYLTTTVIGELAVAIERLPAGRRRASFRRWLEALIVEHFAGRVLTFDVEAAPTAIAGVLSAVKGISATRYSTAAVRTP
jgi:hypothetical protein